MSTDAKLAADDTASADNDAGYPIVPLHTNPLFGTLYRDPGSLHAKELEEFIPAQMCEELRNVKELLRGGSLFFQVTVSPWRGASRLALTTRCRLFERFTRTLHLPNACVAHAVHELLDRWSTGRRATRKRTGKRRPRLTSA